MFRTREQYLEQGLPNILTALRLLQDYPEYRFVLDQACYVKPLLERYPEEEAAFRRFIAEGRLQIVGGTDVMQDVNMPSGESFVRQVLYGKGYFREKVGVDVTVWWAIDTFGHHAQMPQLLKLAGFRSFWFCRGAASRSLPSELIWQGLDGTQIPAFWHPEGCVIAYDGPADFDEFTRFIQERFNQLRPYGHGPDLAGLAGADAAEPREHLPRFAAEINRKGSVPFRIRFAVPTEFEEVVAKRTNRLVIKGELNPLFQGAYSSRIELKQRMRESERLLTTAEKLGVLSQWLGAPADDALLWRAWEPVLFNQTHDLASGVMVDEVYDDTNRGYDFSQRLADEMIETWLNNVQRRIDTRGDGLPIVVFNTLGWPRSDIATVDVGFSEPDIKDVDLVDAAGRTLPIQIQAAHRFWDGRLKHVRLAFVARDVPALGYSVYHIIPKNSATAFKPGSMPSHEDDIIENEYVRVRFDRATGAMTGLRLKSDDWEALRGPANIVAQETDNGDFWELYKALDAGASIAVTTQQPVPTPDRARFSNGEPGEPGDLLIGPVISEFKVSRPLGAGTFSTSVRLYPGVRRIDITTQILNKDKFVRYRALFPTSTKEGRSVHEIPFGAIERPTGVEFPAQNWMDYGDDQHGLALLNRGLPGNNVTDGTMMLSLLRSTRIQRYGFSESGGYQPGASSDTGLELGKSSTLRYSLLPHPGRWREAHVYRAGLEFNHPLLVRKAAPHEGTLPNRWGLLEVSEPNVVVSALKPGLSGWAVLRFYEATGKSMPGVTIRLQAPVVLAQESNLMEDDGKKLIVQNDILQVDLAPFEIKTLKLRLRSDKLLR